MEQPNITFEEIMLELKALGNERMKRIYVGNGAHEPLFGVATGAMKPLFKRIKLNQLMAERLYATGNYDAMYFAGMIAEPKTMTAADFDRWMETAYFYMLSDFVVAITLAEADCAIEVASRWLKSDNERFLSAGWACHEWLLGFRKDNYFDRDYLFALLNTANADVANAPEHINDRINGVVAAIGISYIPLHEEAYQVAAGNPELSYALKAIEKAKQNGKVGFKRKAVRC